ncbi:MBL fold metallo-hydrolase [Luteibacter sp. UNCMF331Sha3.1]|uniref:MBL fold metallo-hydrolase RNA specificity domain-containing protein n=1 Tax=Luteibacter sp. UNCMF331Sha3.1 TaxID=1502760 RepID=UPI000B7E129F|nr:MBL fold metallo-hydrolase [Luteibacter sp. UNCMF331Sha3.1]
MSLTCHGAAGEVTGSCHLVACGEHQVLIDCGLFQGDRGSEARNAAGFVFDPGRIDAVLLTHAHLDHCGRLPLLVRNGFNGKIFATAATIELARIVLLDAATLQAEEAARDRMRGEATARPLYDVDDALHTFDFFHAIDYGSAVSVATGMTARFADAGHILGSASIALELVDGAIARTIVFSGDIGNPGRPLLRDPVPAPEADYVVMESTYGDREHRSFAASVDELHGALDDTLRRRGNVVIPTFALERAQEVLHSVAKGMRSGRVMPAPVFLDSPMAISATEVFRRHPECLREPVSTAPEHDPFQMPGLHLTRSTAESMALNTIHAGAVILAGAGMCNGGRVRHHLAHNLWSARSSVVFVGFAAAGTLARRIIDGARNVTLFGQEVPVRAQVWTINGFSAHADKPALLRWLGARPRRRVFLVHGEKERGMRALAAIVAATGRRCHMPAAGERVVLD